MSSTTLEPATAKSHAVTTTLFCFVPCHVRFSYQFLTQDALPGEADNVRSRARTRLAKAKEVSGSGRSRVVKSPEGWPGWHVEATVGLVAGASR